MSKGHHHSPSEAAQIIHKAIEDKDHDVLIKTITHFENDQLQAIADDYVKRFGKALTEALKDSASYGDYITQLVNLVTPRSHFAARTIHNAVTGAGTDEHAIIDVVTHITDQQVADLKEAYSVLFQRDLATAISSDLSGHFKKVIAGLLQGHRTAAGNPVQEAEALYGKGEGVWGTDDDYFVEFFTRHSDESLIAIDHAYTAKYNHSLEVAVKKETSGAYQDSLVAIVVPREVYWARRIRHAIAGLGTDDTLLRRAFALNSKDQLRRISAVYEAVNKGKALYSDVADDTSGHYKTLFLSILESL